jgi:hypothetical protein
MAFCSRGAWFTDSVLPHPYWSPSLQVVNSASYGEMSRRSPQGEGGPLSRNQMAEIAQCGESYPKARPINHLQERPFAISDLHRLSR